MRKGVILYGPPASGKDTIANALVKRSNQFVKYALLKAGPGNQVGYRMTTPEAIEKKDATGDILWQSDRYNSTYAIDRDGFERINDDEIVIVQVGQIDAVDAIRDVDIDWFLTSLWCPRNEAELRLTSRGGVDVPERLRTWDKTEPVDADQEFDTAIESEQHVVDQIASALDL